VFAPQLVLSTGITMSSKTHTAVATISVNQFDVIQVPTPKPGEGEVLIKVAYAAMIAFDTYMNDLGYLATTFPMTFGFSASGTIAEVGPGIHDLKVGDRVSIPLRCGACVDFVVQVTAFTFHNSEAKAMQEYTLQTRSVTSKVIISFRLICNKALMSFCSVLDS
jgi:NADPH:quinone reductase-like Zn-dependent oxidoreductase